MYCEADQAPPSASLEKIELYYERILLHYMRIQCGKYEYFLRPHYIPNLEDLFDLTDLSIDNRRYWWRKPQKFQKLRSEKYRGKGFTTCEYATWKGHNDAECKAHEAPPCLKHPVRDCLRWEDGELDVPPWDADEAAAVNDTLPKALADLSIERAAPLNDNYRDSHTCMTTLTPGCDD
jgi:hypothetical protein